ncbi:hypothetical protein C6496_16535 [Candidatus Poribacteria bacterium]|nr:MAG: hypothetical protein C6496_16535 [Candidatus Poribacteria bacterium]
MESGDRWLEMSQNTTVERVMRENIGGNPVMTRDWTNLSQNTTLSHFATVEKGSLVHRDDSNP